MTRYAHYDPLHASPAPVTGWYDAEALRYPQLPAASELVQVTDAQWAQHFANPNGWTVVDGQLTAPKS